MAKVFSFPFRTVAEISIPALLRNLFIIRNTTGRDVIPVVKADAYGHGLIPISKALVHRGSCEMLAVATLEEALDLRKYLPSRTQLLVLSGFLPHQISAYIKHRIIPVIHNLQHLKALQGHRLSLHLKIDTGMRRLGIAETEIDDAIRLLRQMDIKLSGVASHFAESEVSPSNFSSQQLTLFERCLGRLRSEGLLQTDAKIHIANSGGAIHRHIGPSTSIRPGLMLYGISPNPRSGIADQLVPVLQWKARVLVLKEIHKGDTVGYGRTYRARRKEKLAILTIGYADGYSRRLSRFGKVIIAGHRVSIRGRVSMDLLTVDVPHGSHVREGASAILIGGHGKERITAWDLAHWADTIPYEILCGISNRVPRVYVD